MQESAPGAAGCPRCGGRGWIVEDGPGAGSARPCDCRLEGLGPRLLGRSGIPPRYRGCTLANFQVDDPDPGRRDQLVRARSLARRYVEEFLREDGGFAETGLLLVGPPGVGKTHLAAAVLSELVRRYRVRGRFVDFTALIHQIQSTFDPSSRESKHQILDPVTDAEVLVLDDLGAQKPSPWVGELLYLVLNTRYSRRLPTLVTTNCSLEPQSVSADAPPGRGGREPLEYRIPRALVSRLWEMTLPIEVEAGDFRREIKHELVRRGL